MDSVLCIHFLNSACKFGDTCQKYHPDADHIGIARLEWKQKRTSEICKDTNVHNVCNKLHIQRPVNILERFNLKYSNIRNPNLDKTLEIFLNDNNSEFIDHILKIIVYGNDLHMKKNKLVSDELNDNLLDIKEFIKHRLAQME